MPEEKRAKVTYADGSEYRSNTQGVAFLREAARYNRHELIDAVIEDCVIEHCGFYHNFKGTEFRNCTFDNVNMDLCTFENVKLVDCEVKNPRGEVSWWNACTVIKDGKVHKSDELTNESIAKTIGGKVFSLPNKEFVKVSVECNFCHREYERIMRRSSARPWMKVVPNTDKRVCDDCYSHYRLEEKILGHRHYGYAGALSFYRTPMDKANTAILGLEMEFEGDFYGWKELQDAHKGQLHYGYDTSVRGQNELSWDCGSYSWWKYLSTLKDVCAALKKGGGEAGDTAGIHIHVSRPDVSVSSVTEKINTMCSSGVFNVLMRAVSLRNDRERFERYASLTSPYNDHHAAISYNGHRTCEFRVFNSSLDDRLILKHLAFCKYIFNAVADKVPQSEIIKKMPKTMKKYIENCATIQKDKGFITEREYKMLIKEITK